MPVTRKASLVRSKYRKNTWSTGNKVVKYKGAQRLRPVRYVDTRACSCRGLYRMPLGDLNTFEILEQCKAGDWALLCGTQMVRSVSRLLCVLEQKGYLESVRVVQCQVHPVMRIVSRVTFLGRVYLHSREGRANPDGG